MVFFEVSCMESILGLLCRLFLLIIKVEERVSIASWIAAGRIAVHSILFQRLSQLGQLSFTKYHQISTEIH